jgi:D-3-phosphoglycerate dehydrogenase
LSAAQPPFRFWFERPPPTEYAELLDGCGVIIGSHKTSRDRLAAVVDAQAIVASARVRYDANLMDRAPQLRVISRTGMGLDNIAIDEASARGIAICNVPDGPTVSTAEHTIALMLAVAKQLAPAGQAIRDGRGDFFNEYQGVEVAGLCLGLVGFGNIGSRVAPMAKGLDMRVMAFDPFVDRAHMEAMGVECAPDLETLLATADVVSLHTPLTDDTRLIINTKSLAQMKRGSILVNAARGGLVDEVAVLRALERKHLRGAGLDVFQTEPPDPTNELLRRDDVVVTPHIAGATVASKDRLWRTAITQALQALRGERPAHLVNPAFLETVDVGRSDSCV